MGRNRTSKQVGKNVGATLLYSHQEGPGID